MALNKKQAEAADELAAACRMYFHLDAELRELDNPFRESNKPLAEQTRREIVEHAYAMNEAARWLLDELKVKVDK